jgi:hypothetical protein
MNNHKVLVFKTDEGEWQGEVNGDGNPQLTAEYGYVMDPDGCLARAAVLREANAIMTAKTRFPHLQELPEDRDDLATFIHSYQEAPGRSTPLPSHLFGEQQLDDASIREGIYGAVLGSDSLGATIGHALLALPASERTAVIASAVCKG